MKTKMRLLLVLAAVAVRAAAPAWDPACDETRDGRYTFTKLGGSAAQPVTIGLCADAACSKTSAFATVREDTHSAPRPAGVARPYFVVERQGVKRTIGARHLALEGAYNFRDLGGLRTQDGKSIRWGQVFRSDSLDSLTAADYERLNVIGISLVCDLRTREERQTWPTTWKDASPMFLLSPVSEERNGSSRNNGLESALRSGNMSLEEGRQVFEQNYARMVLESAAKFGTVLRAIASSQAPSMFHCRGGRDRTGITAALLMQILGVPRQTILDDYVLSTVYLDQRPTPLVPAAASNSEADVRGAKLYAEVIQLQPRYIEAVFREISKKYGTFDRYRREALQLSDADAARLKTWLLQ